MSEAASERLLFLTGHLAYASLCRELEGLAKRSFSYQVHDLGINVAGLMTAAMIRRRLNDTMGADRIIVPGLCSGRIDELSEHFGVPVEKGPVDLKDLAEYFGTQGRQIDLSQYRVKIFAEIVDAPHLNVEDILVRARRYRSDGANVIDLGCLPETPFEPMEDAIQALHEDGFEVSVDSLEKHELLRAGKAGADYLLSLNENTLSLADEIASTPILIPNQGNDLDSLCRTIELFCKQYPEREFYADPIIEPIHFGFTASLVRYYELRQRLPDVPIMMGTGNITELTDADTPGMTALLMGIISELDITAILTTEVSPHCSSAVREADLARRMMLAARNDERLPRGYHSGLMALRERKPFPYSAEEIAANAAAVKDPNFRIQLSRDGIHIYNRDGLTSATDPFELFPHLNVADDGAHAFYLGAELARAQIAWQLGKRYLQDNELNWACALPEPPDNSADGYKQAGTTLRAARKR